MACNHKPGNRVEAVTDDVEWYLEFYCKPEDYFPRNTIPIQFIQRGPRGNGKTVKPGKALIWVVVSVIPLLLVQKWF